MGISRKLFHLIRVVGVRETICEVDGLPANNQRRNLVRRSEHFGTVYLALSVSSSRSYSGTLLVVRFNRSNFGS